MVSPDYIAETKAKVSEEVSAESTSEEQIHVTYNEICRLGDSLYKEEKIIERTLFNPREKVNIPNPIKNILHTFVKMELQDLIAPIVKEAPPQLPAVCPWISQNQTQVELAVIQDEQVDEKSFIPVTKKKSMKAPVDLASLPKCPNLTRVFPACRYGQNCKRSGCKFSHQLKTNDTNTKKMKLEYLNGNGNGIPKEYENAHVPKPVCPWIRPPSIQTVNLVDIQTEQEAVAPSVMVTASEYSHRVYDNPRPCRYGQNCNRVDCRFDHSTQQPETCRFGSNCTNSNCRYFHTAPRCDVGWVEVKKTKQQPVEEDKTKLLKTKLCKYGDKCNLGKKCTFAHSDAELRTKPCRFNINCRNPSCSFSHTR